MDFEIDELAGVKHVRPHGELVGDQTDFIDAITNLITAPGIRIVIDLSDVPFMNSTGLSELVRIVAQANIQEARVVLANLSPFVAGVLQTTQLVRFFEIYATTEEALARLE